jgi:hypothetical protein
LTVLLVALLAGGLAPSAHAQLAAVGPVDVATGFPAFYGDLQGFQLGLCDVFDPNLPESPPCAGTELIDPNGGFVAGNIGEALYYGLGASIEGPNNELFLFISGIEAAGDGGEIVFNLVRLRLRLLQVAGNYSVQTPFGNFGPFAGGPGNDIDAEVAVPGVAPDFAGALNGPVNIFLENGTGFTDPNTGDVFFGDGVTEAPITTAGFVGTEFRVIGPGGINVATTNFVVEGKVANFVPPTVVVNRATYERGAAGSGQVDVFASGPANAVLTVSGTGIPSAPMTGSAIGAAANFFASIPVPAPFTPPLTITVTDSSVNPPAPANALLLDVVNVTKAVYNKTSETLSIEAVSSDQGAPAPILSADGFGALLGGSLVVSPVAVPPAKVTVVSSKGGADSKVVQLISEVLTINRATFNRTARRWLISGTSTIAGPGNTITLHLGNSALGPVIGTVQVDALGVWSFSRRPTPVALRPPRAGGFVTAVSSFGTTATVPVPTLP